MMLAYTVLLCVIAYSQSFTSVSKVGFLRVNKLFARSSGRSGETEKGSIRQARVARAIRDELTEIICDVDIKATNYPSESLLRSVSITDVDVSHDLLFAKAYITVLGNSVEKRQIFVWLSENVGQIRYSLAKRMRSMRRVPDISFKLSDTKNMMDLVNLIEEVVPQTVASDDDVEFEEDDEEE